MANSSKSFNLRDPEFLCSNDRIVNSRSTNRKEKKMIKGVLVYKPCFAFVAIHENLETNSSNLSTRTTQFILYKQIIEMLSIDKLQPFENFPVWE